MKILLSILLSCSYAFAQDIAPLVTLKAPVSSSSLPVLKDSLGFSVTAAATKTWPVTVSSGSNRFLLYFHGNQNGNTGYLDSATLVNRPNSWQTLTRRDSITQGGTISASAWTLIAPFVGNDTLLLYQHGSTIMAGRYEVWQGVNQTTPYNTFSHAAGSSTSLALSGVASAANQVPIAFSTMGVAGTFTSSQTVYDAWVMNSTSRSSFLMITQTGASPSVTFNVSLGTSGRVVMIGVSLQGI